MAKGDTPAILLFIFIVLLSIADIGLNLLGLIPFVGVIFETISETIFELLTISAAFLITLLKIRDTN